MTPPKEGPGIDLAALKVLFAETLEEQMAPLRETVSQLQDKLAEVDRQTPKMRPMQRQPNPSGMPQTPAEAVAQMVRSGDRGHDGTARSVMTTINGKPMDQGALKAFMDSFQPEFEAGDAVRINPEAYRLGWPQEQTWNTLLAKGTTNPEGYGTVREILKFSHRGWMYRVKVAEHTPERGMCFDQHELLHA